MKFIAAILALGLLTTVASAQTSQQIPAKLICGAHTGVRHAGPFQINLTFELSGGQLSAKRKTRTKPGEETFSGTVSAMGDILVNGVGQYENGATWIYEFHGTRDDRHDTKIIGRLTSTNGPVGYRQCSIIFHKPRSL